MNLKYFGDSYDILKKTFIGWLFDFGPWAAHPMFTKPVTAEEAEKFARFLGARLLSDECLTPKCERATYFSQCAGVGNLFLDPDTGVRLTKKGGLRSVNYVFASELIEWSHARPNSLTIVFDQSYSRGRQEGLMQEKLGYFVAHGVYGFAYSSHAPFLFLSSNKDLSDRARKQIIEVSKLPEERLVRLNNIED